MKALLALIPAVFLSACGVSTAPDPRLAAGVRYANTSWYNQGTRTANGEHFRPGGYTAAHRTLPFGTQLRLTNPHTGRTVVVRVNDRGPAKWTHRELDVAQGAAAQLGMIGAGTAKLRMEVLR